MIINCIEPWGGFTLYTALDVFRYVHITPVLLTLTLILKPLSDYPCSPLGFLPGTVLWKLVFQYDDDLDYMILQGDCIDLYISVSLKVLIRILRNGCGG